MQRVFPALSLITVLLTCSPKVTAQNQMADDQNAALIHTSIENEIESSDGRLLNYFIDRRASTEKIPALIVIDGSGCVGARRDGFLQLMAPEHNPDLSFARVVVSKSGVPAEKSDPVNCSETFLKSYAMDDRLIDHLRVMQDIRLTADWWDGRFLIYGWSDGGDIAAQLFAYSPDTEKLAFGGVGGGYTMKEHFIDFWVCPEGVDQREICVRDLEKQFAEIESNPTHKKTWSGEDNSFKAWESRLNTTLTPLFKREKRPILMIHGASDFDGAPVHSAQQLFQDVGGEAHPSFSYWEIEGMQHDMWSLPPEDAIALETRVLHWLLE